METREPKIETKLKRKLLVARQLILLERVWKFSGPLFCTLLLFCASTLAGGWTVLSPYIHFAGLLAFAAAFIASLWYLIRHFSLPKEEEGLARLEWENSLKHRPLRSSDANPILSEQTTARTQFLWHLHLKQQLMALGKVRLFAPRLGVSSGDSWSFRALSILLLVIGIGMGGSGALSHFKTAFSVNLLGPVAKIEADIWAVPPDYTALAPVLLVQQKTETVDEIQTNGVSAFKVPQGSKLIGRLTGGSEDTPLLRNGQDSFAFDTVERGNFQVNLEDIQSGRWSLEKDGDIVASWDVDLIPDLAPLIKILTLPAETDRSALQLVVLAEDDYGVVELSGLITRDGQEDAILLPLPFVLGAKTVESKSYHDLTAHPWAGLTVNLQVTAKDEAGQIGTSQVVKLKLPERVFTNPIARALVAERKRLMADPEQNRIPVIESLSIITSLPEAESEDVGAMLMVSVARGILLFESGDETYKEVAELLWQAALKFENGNLTLAERALREAQQRLMDALNNGASDEEIQKLVEELKQAMSDFLQEMAKNQQMQSGEQQPMQQGDQNQMLSNQDLNNMLDQIDQLSRSGAREDAKNLLSQLQDILENLQMASPMMQSPSQQAGQKMLNELGEMLKQQQDLLDQTMRSSRRSGNLKDQPLSKQAEQLRRLAEEQEKLRQKLGEMMADMGMQGKIPGSLGQAERSMNSARGQLESGQGGQAQTSQKNAMDALQRTMEGLAQQMMQAGHGQPQGQVGAQGNRDPLGRPVQENGQGGRDNNQFKIFDKGYLSTTRQILDELRRRLTDPARPEGEKQYLRRLMERFQ
ncbi:TIGR02302 family protein [Sneathiella limimaris]|uniref:TIGR02302 family protein n=1 Tax=Sneathiella limimaris TaxID=1964213 RepID=UPI00146DFE5B|nr:TIGR02302 family protein [Sneathiella limimaris]